ncbi:MAG: hypothetical protein V3S44_03315, partial [Alphaproteobacteria bacterium]
VGRRRIVTADGEATEAEIWRRSELAPGTVLHGPVIIEQPDATTVVPPGWSARCDAVGNLDLRWEGTS